MKIEKNKSKNLGNVNLGSVNSDEVNFDKVCQDDESRYCDVHFNKKVYRVDTEKLRDIFNMLIETARIRKAKGSAEFFGDVINENVYVNKEGKSMKYFENEEFAIKRFLREHDMLFEEFLELLGRE